MTNRCLYLICILHFCELTKQIDNWWLKLNLKICKYFYRLYVDLRLFSSHLRIRGGATEDSGR